MQTPRVGPGGLSELGDDREEGRLEIRGLGIEDDQPVQDLLPQRLTGQVGLLVAGPGAGGHPAAREQDPGEVARAKCRSA